MAHQNYRFGSVVQAVFDAGNGSLNPTKCVCVCVCGVNIKCLVQTSSLHLEQAWHFGKKYKFDQTVPLVVSDLLVLHWNIKINPEKRKIA